MHDIIYIYQTTLWRNRFMFLLACKLKLAPHIFLLEFQEGIGWKGLDTVHVLEKLICILIET